jgi:hypothetical protein
MENNPGSIRTAEKLGFVFQKHYNIYYLEFDELWDQIQFGGHLISSGDFSAGLEECEKALAVTSSPPPALLIHTARAQAMLGLNELALETIERLVETGWRDLAFLQNDQKLIGLHGFDRWKAVTARLKSCQTALP